MSDPAADALRTTSDVLALAAAALPPPLGIVARILSAAAGAASVAVDSGRTEAEVVASIRRIDAIDVAGQDAAADERIRRRREEERARTERGDEPTREIPTDLSLGPRPR